MLSNSCRNISKTTAQVQDQSIIRGSVSNSIMDTMLRNHPIPGSFSPRFFKSASIERLAPYQACRITGPIVRPGVRRNHSIIGDGREWLHGLTKCCKTATDFAGEHRTRTRRMDSEAPDSQGTKPQPSATDWVCNLIFPESEFVDS